LTGESLVRAHPAPRPSTPSVCPGIIADSWGRRQHDDPRIQMCRVPTPWRGADRRSRTGTL